MDTKTFINNVNTPLSRFIAFMIMLVVMWFLLPNEIASDEQNKIELFPEINYAYIDSLVDNMTIEQKIGQLLFIKKDAVTPLNKDSIEHWIKTMNIAGISSRMLMDSNYIKQLNNYAHFPLFIGNHSENLIQEALTPLIFPCKNAIEAIRNNELRQDYYCLSSKLRKYKHINFNLIAPFYIEGLKDIKTLDTKELQLRDKGWIELEKISKTYGYDKSIASLPGFYGYMPEHTNGSSSFTGIAMKSVTKNKIMSLYFEQKTLSDSTLIHLIADLKNKHYEGLTICKAEKNITIEQLFDAGTDLFVVSDSIQETYNKIRRLVDLNRFPEQEITYRAKKVITAKYWMGLLNNTTHNAIVLNKQDSIEHLLLSNKLSEQSIVLYNNTNETIPINDVSDESNIVLINSDNKLLELNKQIAAYTRFETKNFNDNKILIAYIKENYKKNLLLLCLPLDSTYKEQNALISALNKIPKNIVLLDFNKTKIPDSLKSNIPLVKCYSNTALNHKYTAQILFGGIAAKGVSLCSSMRCDTTSVSRVKYTIPEEVGLSSDILARIDTIALEAIANSATPGMQVFVAKQGKVVFNKGYGYQTYSRNTKINTNSLYDIASVTKIAAATLSAMKAYDQKKININTALEKCFKNTTIEYTRITPDTIINIDTLKISEIRDLKKLIAEADTIHLNDSMIVAIDTIIYKYNPKNNIFKVTFNDLLRHESGVLPSLPILNMYLYKANAKKKMEQKRLLKVIDSLSNSQITTTDSVQHADIQPLTNNDSIPKDSIRYGFDRYYTKEMTNDAAYPIAENMFLRKEYFDTLWMDIKQLPVHHTKVYQYSDVSMILIQQALDSLNEMSMKDYFYEEFANPIGLQRISYLPLEKYNKSEIVPTSLDRVWRSQLLHGYVHDPSAAFLGGVSGNAGLFSSAHDLGVLFQMVLNKGSYGGKQYFSKETVERFTKIQAGSARGLGFDTQMAQNIIAEDAPDVTYGHTGFTGCCVWVDPVNEIVFVFLSNRVHPKSRNWKLNALRIRQRIHQTVYDAIIPKGEEKEKKTTEKNKEYLADINRKKKLQNTKQ